MNSREQVISVALTVKFIHHGEVWYCFVFLHIMEKKDIDI